MVKFMVLMAFSGMLSSPLWSELPQMPNCLPRAQFEPALVSNPDVKVTFRCRDATSLDLIRAIGRQTRLPIGVVLGRHPLALTGVQHSYNLENVDVTEALTKAIEGTGYAWKKEGAVYVLMASDLAPRQKKMLTHPFNDFPSVRQTMDMFAFMLTTWMRAAFDNVGTGGSILGSTNDEQISFSHMQSASTGEIADQIVSQGSRGLWILRMDASAKTKAPSDDIEIESYQHYTNGPG